MTSRTSYQQRLNNYLQQYRWRYKLRIALIAIAALIFAALTISLFTAVLGDTLAYSSWLYYPCLLYTSPSPRDGLLSRMPSSA